MSNFAKLYEKIELQCCLDRSQPMRKMTFPYMISFIEHQDINTYAALKPVESCEHASVFIIKMIDNWLKENEWNSPSMSAPRPTNDLFTSDIIASLVEKQTTHNPALIYSVDNGCKTVLEITIRKNQV